MIRIGLVGLGFMGMIHFLAARRTAGVQVVALSSRDPRKLAGDWTEIQGNFGPRGTQMDLSGLRGYSKYEELLNDPDVDLIDLCVPNRSHASMAIEALAAGKHVLVEKPIALSNEDAEAMTLAAEKHGRLLMVAHVLPFFPEFAHAAEIIRSGRHGAVRALHLTRVITKPLWSEAFRDARQSGGPVIDLHVHDTHFLSLILGAPRAVRSRGVIVGEAVAHVTTQYLYDDPNLAVSAVSGALSQSGRPFTHQLDVYLERATLAYSMSNLADTGPSITPLSVFLPERQVERPPVGSSDPIDAFSAELAAAARSVQSGVVEPPLSGELARQALRICLAEAESVRTGNEVFVS